LITIAAGPVVTYNIPKNTGNIVYSESDFEAVNLFIVWKPSTATPLAQNKVSNHIGYEARSSQLFLKSSLVKDFNSTIHDTQNDITMTTQQNILQIVPINVNIYSWIHYRSSQTESLVHELSGQAINSFTITLTDDEHNTFGEGSFKNFQCVLMFETQDNLAVRKLNEQVIEKNQNSIFKANHNC